MADDLSMQHVPPLGQYLLVSVSSHSRLNSGLTQEPGQLGGGGVVVVVVVVDVVGAWVVVEVVIIGNRVKLVR